MEENNNSSESVASEESSLAVMIEEYKARVQHQKEIVAAIEDLFSDENLAKDVFLLRHIRRRKDGYANLELVVTNRKVAKVSKDLPVIRAAIQGRSHKLRMNVELIKIRRVEPIPPALEKKVEIENKWKDYLTKVEESKLSALPPRDNEDGDALKTPPSNEQGSGEALSVQKTSQWLQKHLIAKAKFPSKLTGPLMVSTVIRQPRGPPSDGSSGFNPGGRTQLLLERLENEKIESSLE